MDKALAFVLAQIEANEKNYDKRAVLVAQALSIAMQMGLEAGVRVDPKEPDWPVVCIKLPQGEVSWHCPSYKQPYTGYTTEEKYARARAYGASVKAPAQ